MEQKKRFNKKTRDKIPCISLFMHSPRKGTMALSGIMVLTIGIFAFGSLVEMNLNKIKGGKV